MKPIPLLKAFLILLFLIFLVTGVMYAAGPSLSVAAFSTSYRDYPDLAPMPTAKPDDVVNVPGLIRAFDIGADKRTIAIATSTDLILYDLQTLREIHSIPLRERAFQVRFSPDGSKLALGAILLKYLESGVLRVTVWDAHSWNVLYEYESDSQGAVPEGGLAWSPDGKQIAFSIPERGLSVVDVESGRAAASLEDFLVPPFDLSWSPDGLRLIATGDLGYGLRRWRLDTNEWVRLWDKRLQPAQHAAWSPDGTRIASGHFGGAVCVWNARNNQCRGFIQAHFNSVNALDWSPDGGQIATASGAIRVWDADTGEMSSAFGFYDGLLYKELRWFDHNAIATLETSYTQSVPAAIRVWDVGAGEVKLTFRGWDNIESQSAGGVMLTLDDVQISDERTILQVSLRFDTPQHSVAGQWNVTMTDSQGRIYPLEDITPQTMDIGVTRVYQTVPLPLGGQIALKLVSFPLQGGMPLMLDLSANPGRLTFDPGALQIGETMTLDREIQANGYLLRLTGVRKATANELLFEFDSQGYLNGVMLFSPAAGGASTNLVKNDKVAASLSFSEMPNEPMEIEVTSIFYTAYGSWNLEFQAAASMFSDEPSMPQAEQVRETEPPPPAAIPTPAFDDPQWLELANLAQTFDAPFQQGPGWIHYLAETETHRVDGQSYPPPYITSEQWLEIDEDGYVIRSFWTDRDAAGTVLQQSVAFGDSFVNFTTGESGSLGGPRYRFSSSSILQDLNAAAKFNATVLIEEALCDDGSACRLVTILETFDGPVQNPGESQPFTGSIRRLWVNKQSGQVMKTSTSWSLPNGAERTDYTHSVLLVEKTDAPPQEVLDLFARVMFPAP